MNLALLHHIFIASHFHCRSSLGTKVDIRELTWEQKEKVIRLLFAKMNGVAHKKKLAKAQKALPHPPKQQLSIQDKPSV